jgi:prepilin-type N-terminal cleavage/methylation domain-containing protein
MARSSSGGEVIPLADSRDDGFTLVELLIAMVILGVIMAPLVTSFVLGLGTAVQAQQDLTNTTDVQAFSAFFTDDVASSDTVKTGTTSCGGADTVVQLAWKDGARNRAAAYVAQVDADMQADLNRSPVYRMDRVICVDGTVTGTFPVARSLAAVPNANCDGSNCPADSTPQRVAVTLEEYGAKAADAHLSFTASATRRVTSP